MKRFVEGADRGQSTLLPECLDDWIDEENPVRAIDVFVDALDLGELGFHGIEPAATGRPGFHPSVLLSSMSTATLIACSRAGGSSAKQDAISSFSGFWAVSCPITRPSPTSARTTAPVYARFAHASWTCAAS